MRLSGVPPIMGIKTQKSQNRPSYIRVSGVSPKCSNYTIKNAFISGPPYNGYKNPKKSK